MLDYYKMRLLQIADTIRAGGFSRLARETCFVGRVAVPVEKDVSLLKPLGDAMLKAGVEIVGISPGTFDKRELVYPVPNRYLKALYYMKIGYRGYALVSGNKVVGDIWYASSKKPGCGPVHPDIDWLGIRCADKEVYAFDMFLEQMQRGKNFAPLLMNGALHEFRKNGFTKVYGYFWKDNIPAMWVHRTLQWKELPAMKTSRFLFVKMT